MGKTERSKWAGAHESISKQATEISRHDPLNPDFALDSIVILSGAKNL